jgi:hypothetical protein
MKRIAFVARFVVGGLLFAAVVYMVLAFPGLLDDRGSTVLPASKLGAFR